MKAKGCIQAKKFIKELSNEWEVRQLQLNILNAKTLVGVITRNPESDYHKFKFGRADSLDCTFSRFGEERTRHILCYCEAPVNKRKLTLGMDLIKEPCLKTNNNRDLLQVWRRVSDGTWNLGIGTWEDAKEAT